MFSYEQGKCVRKQKYWTRLHVKNLQKNYWELLETFNEVESSVMKLRARVVHMSETLHPRLPSTLMLTFVSCVCSYNLIYIGIPMWNECPDLVAHSTQTHVMYMCARIRVHTTLCMYVYERERMCLCGFVWSPNNHGSPLQGYMWRWDCDVCL